MLFRPRNEWNTISGEFTNASRIYWSYILPLSAVGPLASVVAGLIFRTRGTMFGAVSTSLGGAVQYGVAHYVLGLACVYVIAVALDVLAPTFGAQSNRVQALKLAAYASTPAWLAGALLLIPQLGLLVWLGVVYMLWLVGLGAPVVMKIPADAREKASAYRAITVIVTLVLTLIFEAVAEAFGG
jgi:Yip1-like protein